MVYFRFILRYNAVCFSDDIFCHSSIIITSHSNFSPFFIRFCRVLSVTMLHSTSASKFMILMASFQPSKIDNRLLVMMIFLAFLCLAIAKAQIVLPLPYPPKASRKIPFVNLELRETASFCHFLKIKFVTLYTSKSSGFS